ncbi:Terminal uridylyltransferase cid1 [Hypsizygus marmoreus]|uniref:polynucleotide adenylyltransferase n=1 Tax=Hypsizygus marmoreus TaxID=39966 RepID=A0A369JW28_HYPMA|nr:Terminal uridylyltransferase cid1 [Hypsizygus marmoreus]
MSPQPIHNHFRDVQAPQTPPMQRRHTSKQRFVADLSQCLFDFVIQLLPTTEELAVKEDVRKLLERLIRTLEPESRLLSFGSTANGFSLRNSDMDLCCLIDSKERLAATDLVTMLGDLLERETKFHVKPLPHARIPIVKLSLDPSPGLPLGIACDIGFENRLALENTRLLMCYAMIDPTRVRTMVLFLKVWSKRRKINSPYKGTLSSYGYVLLVIYFLVHVKNPPVLPNLQQMPPLRPISPEDTLLGGYNTWFFDDIDLLRQRWHSDNTETVAELLIDFFRYYSRDFLYNTGVASIRAGLLKKESKGWQNDLSSGRFNDARERNRLCIEDPFELDYNVARCVTKDGLYTIRGEFMRATRVLASRPDRAIVALAELCEERKDEDLVSAPSFVSPRISLPPQTPYTVGSQSMRPKGGPPPERLSPPTKFFESGPRQPAQQVSIRPPPPEHMAPRRSKWTSPPPAEAPSADHTLFESKLGQGLELATSSTEAREKETNYNSSSSNSEILTDEDRSDAAESDDVTSVHSFTEGSSTNSPGPQRRPSWHTRDTVVRVPQSQSQSPLGGSPVPGGRARYPRHLDTSPVTSFRPPNEAPMSSSRSESSKRTIPGSPRRGPSWPSSNTPLGVSVPLPPSPDSSPLNPSFAEPSTVFYQTTVPRSPRPNVLYPTPGSHSSLLSQYQTHQYPNINMNPLVPPPDIFPPNLPALTSMNPRVHAGLVADTGRSSAGPETPTPATYSYSHSHSLSNATVTAPTPSPHVNNFSQSVRHSSPYNASASPLQYPRSPARLQSMSRSRSRSLSPPAQVTSTHGGSQYIIMPTTTTATNGSSSPHLSSASNDSSPTASSTGYATSISRSPSPQSLSPPTTAMPSKEKPGHGLVFPLGITAKIHDSLAEDPAVHEVRAGVADLEVALGSQVPSPGAS